MRESAASKKHDGAVYLVLSLAFAVIIHSPILDRVYRMRLRGKRLNSHSDISDV